MSQTEHIKPLAVELLEAYRDGKSAAELSRETGIPADLIEVRLRAAAAFLRRAKERSALSEGQEGRVCGGGSPNRPFKSEALAKSGAGLKAA